MSINKIKTQVQIALKNKNSFELELNALIKAEIHKAEDLLRVLEEVLYKSNNVVLLENTITTLTESHLRLSNKTWNKIISFHSFNDIELSIAIVSGLGTYFFDTQDLKYADFLNSIIRNEEQDVFLRIRAKVALIRIIYGLNSAKIWEISGVELLSENHGDNFIKILNAFP